MVQLILSRALQGLGAGAIIPLSMTIIGELYTLEERGKTQALFSGVWGLASIAGPLVGGYITDALSWRWVFYINLPFGLLALLVIAAGVSAAPAENAGAGGLGRRCADVLRRELRPAGDRRRDRWRAAWLVAGIVLLVTFAYVERRVPEPILPVDMFRNPLIARTNIVAFLFGVAMFGAIAFIPLYVQAVLGGTATQAGQVLTPLFLGWVITSILAARLTVKIGYRPVAMARQRPAHPRVRRPRDADARSSAHAIAPLVPRHGGRHGLLDALAAPGGPAWRRPRSRLGIATSLNQFSRSIGAAIGTAVMGALLTRALAGVQLRRRHRGARRLGRRAHRACPSPGCRTRCTRSSSPAASRRCVALAVTFFLPDVNLSQGVIRRVGEQMLAAEMTTLEPQDEPIAVSLINRNRVCFPIFVKADAGSD